MWSNGFLLYHSCLICNTQHKTCLLFSNGQFVEYVNEDLIIKNWISWNHSNWNSRILCFRTKLPWRKNTHLTYLDCASAFWPYGKHLSRTLLVSITGLEDFSLILKMKIMLFPYGTINKQILKWFIKWNYSKLFSLMQSNITQKIIVQSEKNLRSFFILG